VAAAKQHRFWTLDNFSFGGVEMMKRIKITALFTAASFAFLLAFLLPTQAQQTLGGITGTVTDTSGAVVPNAVITLVSDQTQFTRTEHSSDSGSYLFSNLPIGSYTLTFTHDAFESQKIPSITVQADRTVTVNASLKVGSVSTTVTVEETPLINAVDTTNGYVLDKVQLESVPLPTGSFTGLAILSPGVNAELPSGTGANSGLGNQPIWANGNRDTSNTFLLNGVDAKNLFNGKSTSQVSSARVVNNTGVSGAAQNSSAPIQSTASPYLAIGQALPTPAPETIEEFRVNTSMYDAQQGSTSGAHIDMSTASGTNDIHGQAYLHRGTNDLNAAPFFFKADPNIPDAQKNPELHRVIPGGTLGGPIIKNKLFGFIAYQHVHDSDQEIGFSRMTVPDEFTPQGGNPTLGYSPCGTATSRPTAELETCLVGLVNNNWVGPESFLQFPPSPITTSQINPIALALLQYKLPNGQFLIPYATTTADNINYEENAIIPGTAYFLANQAVGDLDFIATSKDTLALKYYYQHDPSIAPYAYSSVAGFTQKLDAGSQVATITNTQTLTPNFSVAEVFGFIREKTFSSVGQPFTPQQFAAFVESDTGASAAASTINTFGSTTFPGISIVDMLGADSVDNTVGPSVAMTIGEGAASQGAFTGVFQNRFMPSANAVWTKGKHTITFGGSWSYTQLNTRDDRTGKGMIGFTDFSQFVQGLVSPYSVNGFVATTFLTGNANRYYRAHETGEYIQDKFQLRSNLSVTFGLRWDYNGGLTEKNGEIYNFDPSQYDYDAATDTLVSNGFIIAGNNKLFPSKGVSNSTLTGRQWGLAPRLGVAWSPKMFNNKLVVRAGWGIYYDRGELFTYLSPGFAAGVIPGGPFGVNQAPPFVSSQSCVPDLPPYEGFLPTCSPADATGGGFENPWGTATPTAPSGNPADIDKFIPNTGVPGQGVAAGISNGDPLFVFADYNRKNKLPYTLNQTLDIQWQPRNDIAIDIGYVGNLGRHEVIPIPFNQAQIASPANPLLKGTPFEQDYTYGYTVSGPGATLPNGDSYEFNFEGGNVDLRVPFIGYSSESESYTAAGVSAYNALQAHIEKRLSHGLQLGASYTYSHALDEQSGLGLFYNGNNALNLRSGYGNSDFDRTHVINFTYLYEVPKFAAETSWKGRVVDGWAIEGLTILQSGQPYSVIDFSGAVGSIFYGTSDGITNPIVPLAPGCTPKSARTGASGAFPGKPALNSACFTLPLLDAGDLGGAIPQEVPGVVGAGSSYETNFISHGQRNIFRQTWQKRADISIVKKTQINDRVSMRYSFDVFNLTNTPSFDIPIDDITQNLFFNDFPTVGTPVLPTSCTSANVALYSCPTVSGLGNVNKTIGSSRQVQMSLSVLF
jgi:carboxypeptidase family protein